MPWALRMFLLLAAVTLPLYLYVSFRTASAITTLRGSPPGRARLAALAVMAWLYGLPVLYGAIWIAGRRSSAILGGSTLGVLDFLFNFPFWWGLIVLIEALPYFLLLDAVTLASHARAPFRSLWRGWAPWLRLTTLALIALYAALRLSLDTFTVRETPVVVRGTVDAAELDSLTITLVGDVQVDRYTNGAKLRQFERLLRSQTPDLLLFAGDLVTSGKEFIGQAASLMTRPQSRLGAFAVMGDHDYWSDASGIPQALRSSGWTFLTNEHRLIDYRGRRIVLSGVTYVYSQRMAKTDLRAFLASAPAADLKILVVHQPAETLVRLAAESGYHLLLAGHTHGGQIVFHPFGIPLTPSRFETPYYRGVHQVGNTAVVVTAGIGQSLAPVRYGAPAELTRITLRTQR